MESIRWQAGQALSVTPPGTGNPVISVGHSSFNNGSYGSMDEERGVAGIGVDGFTVSQDSSAQSFRKARAAGRKPGKKVAGPSLILAFKTTEADQLVLVLVGAQGAGALTFAGVEATTLQNESYSVGGSSSTIASVAAYELQLAPGKHKIKLRSTTYTPSDGASIGAVAYVLSPAPLPELSGVTPSEGPQAGGTSVTLTGAHLAGATVVHFGARTADSFKVKSPDELQAISPEGMGKVPVTVTTATGTSSPTAAAEFTYVPPPTVSAISPTVGPEGGGTAVRITGTSLTGATGVQFGAGAAESYNVISSGTVEAVAPSGSGTVNVVVTTPYGTSSTVAGDQFAYIAPPSVAGVNPGSGPESGGTAVTITGDNFNEATGGDFGSSSAAFKVTSNNSTEATVPSGHGSVSVRVTTPYGVSTQDGQFSYNPPPSPSISLSVGPYHGNGAYDFAVQVHNFPTGRFRYYCYDNEHGPFEVFYTNEVTVTEPNKSSWPGQFCWDTAPYVAYLVMDGVQSNSAQF